MTVYSVFITSSGALRTFFYSLIRIEDKKLTQMDKIKRRPIAWAFLSTNLQILLYSYIFECQQFLTIFFANLRF